ncbi:tripartite tricarboxylate transporter substrate-binding protein [Pseudokineococcus marinus]|uniref:Tripartite tricarboxylate transporter substrate binding protein n=1 Tax=Pseudokineococcus marinus TaxID=351215 RepID=A0A849BN35_9ACTN|nr:tripartite tricarboxylate transporter substrate-binding protein [Pseudokineococcus marinus]NNH24610.1 tripartite tricarboxylate transporter substrate binding protein [Pseudokineococcus marinus]
MRRRARAVIGVALLVPLVGAAAWDARSAGTLSGARTGLTIIAPASPGGGWDTLARRLQGTMRETGVVTNPQVVNITGAAGTIGLAQLQQMEGRGDVLMVTGTVMVGGVEINDSPVGFDDVTPIARTTDDYEVVVVPADSPLESVDDLVAAWQEDPGAVAVGGGSLGGTDQLLAAQLALEVGVPATEVNYIAYSGGGEAIQALLSGASDVGISGYNEFADQIEAGTLRALAMSAPEPQPEVGIPTLYELGYDVHQGNWRGVLAPPGLTDEERQELTDIVSETLATPEWQQVLETNAWVDAELTGDDFTTFIDEEVARIQAILEEAGL